MKKKIVLLAVILIMTLCGCESILKSKVSYIENDIMSENLKTTLKDCYQQNGDSVSINLVSFESEIAPIKILALQNLYGLQNIDIAEYKEKYNPYKYSIEKTIYKKEDLVLVEQLTSDSSEEDFFDAYYAGEKINDDNLKEIVSEQYNKYVGSSYNLVSEEIYRYINCKYAGKEENTEKEIIQNKVYECINRQVENEGLDTTPEGLTELRSALAFLNIENDNSQNEKIKELYSSFVAEPNEKMMIFSMDICLEYYSHIISYMRELLEIEEGADLFCKQAEEGKEIYREVIYDVTSPKNFDLYITALCYIDEKIDTDKYDALKQLFIQIQNNTNLKDYSGVYYLNHAAKLLGIDMGISTVAAEENENSYYYMLLSGNKREFKELYRENGTIQELLYACDCSKNSKEKKEVLKKISILDYENETDFAMLLNLYVINMLENELMTPKIKNTIETYIKNSECVYGYAKTGNVYDFRTSVYDTNILYLLNGGEDIGLR